MTIVGTSTVGGELFPVDKLIIFSTASLISWTDAKLITTDKITIAIGSNFVLPEKYVYTFGSNHLIFMGVVTKFSILPIHFEKI